MKQKYHNPECQVLRMSLCDLLTVSLLEQGDGDLDGYDFPDIGA